MGSIVDQQIFEILVNQRLPTLAKHLESVRDRVSVLQPLDTHAV